MLGLREEWLVVAVVSPKGFVYGRDSTWVSQHTETS